MASSLSTDGTPPTGAKVSMPVQRIIDEKTRSNQYKEHPDAPGDLSAMMFYVLVGLESVAEDEHEDRVTMEVSGETHGEQVPEL